MKKLKARAKECFYCGEGFEENEHRSIIGVDRPYINLPFHKDCLRKVKSSGEEEYLQKNKKRIFKWAEEK